MKSLGELLRFQRWNTTLHNSTKEFKNYNYLLAGVVILLIFILSLTKYNGYFLPVMALLSVGGGSILFSLAGIKNSFHILLFSFPLSLNLPVNASTQMMIPSELLVISFGLSVIFFWIRNAEKFVEFLKKPVSVALCFYLIFLLISAISSDMLIVSAKAVVVKVLFFIAFYGGGYIYFKQEKFKAKFVKYYLLPLIAVIAFVIIRHSEFLFSKDASGFVTRPFFQDHTIYSTVLAFMIPLTGSLVYYTKGLTKALYAIIFVVLVTAIIFAASRAAWLSLIVASALALLIRIRFPVNAFALLLILLPFIVYFNSDELMWRLKANRFDSGARNASIEDQTRSVTNITNDQSNAERINRWKCAVRMFLARPLTGYGPGTYQFSYFPFQREKEMTRISVKSPYNIAEGRGGTAHNEFLLILSEAGIFTAVAFTAAILIALFTGLNSCYKSNTGYLNVAMLLAFVTFIVHNLFNNFLDTDKAAVLFFIAMAYFATIHTVKKTFAGYEG